MTNKEMINSFIAKQKKYDGIVYLISDGTYVKIGYTKSSVTSRLETMQTGNANKLQILAYAKVMQSSKLEKYLHNRYKEYQHRREWFKFNTDGLVHDIVHILRKCEKDDNYVYSLIKEHELSKETNKKQNKHSARQAGIVGYGNISSQNHSIERLQKIQEKNRKRAIKHQKFIDSLKDKN